MNIANLEKRKKVFIPNEIIISEATGLNQVSYKLLFLTLSVYNKDQDPKDFYYLKIKDVLKVLGMNEKNYKEIRKTTKNIMSLVIGIESDKDNPKGSYLEQINIYNKFIHEGRSYLKFRFHSDAIKILNRSDCNTRWEDNIEFYDVLKKLKGSYSQKVYMKASQYKNSKQKSIYYSLEDLRKTLNIGKNEYPSYANLNQRVLKPSITEVTQKTDISITITPKKDVRKIVGVTFNIQKQEHYKLEKVLSKVEKILIENIKIDKKEVVKFVEKVKGDTQLLYEVVKLTKKAVDKNKDKITNLSAYYHSAITKNLANPEFMQLAMDSAKKEKIKKIQEEKKKEVEKEGSERDVENKKWDTFRKDKLRVKEAWESETIKREIKKNENGFMYVKAEKIAQNTFKTDLQHLTSEQIYFALNLEWKKEALLGQVLKSLMKPFWNK